VPAAAVWGRAAVVLLLLREGVLAGRPLTARQAQRARTVLGPSLAGLLGRSVPALDDVAAHLPGDVRWVLRDVRGELDLWTAEARWWHRVEDDGFTLSRGASFGPSPVVGAVAVLAADAWRVRAALGAAARGDGTGGPSRHELLETFDALA
jgi:hypothetical protein